jgi:hypothetical protein
MSVQTKLFNYIDRDSIQLPCSDGVLCWMTYMEDATFVIEIQFFDLEEEE